MLRPVLVSPPEMLPVSLEEAKRHLRVKHSLEDDLIRGLIGAATVHLDGWTGILGRCLVEQIWRQDFDRFERCLVLPLGPVISVTSVTWRNAAGQIATVASGSYALRTDAGGRSVVSFDRDFTFPIDLHESAAVAVTYRAGYPNIPEIPAVEPGEGDPPDPPGSPAIPAQPNIPEPIRIAILLLVGAWYENREETAIGVSVASLPEHIGAHALLSPYRAMRL